MSRTTTFLATGSSCMLVAGMAQAATLSISTGLDHWRIPVGARAAAMGEALTAIGEGAEALTWNPAGLLSASPHEVFFQHAQWVLGSAFEQFSYVHQLSGAAVAGGVQYVSYGSHDRRDSQGGLSGTKFSASDLSLSAGYARSLRSELSAGAAVRLNQSAYAGTGNTSFAASAGAVWSIARAGLDLGASVRHLGAAGGGAKTPTDLDVAAAYRVPEKTLSSVHGLGLLTLDLGLPVSGPFHAHVGAEARVWDVAALRLGYRFYTGQGDDDSASGLTAGAGVAYGGFLLDFAYAPQGILGRTVRVSLSVRFGAGGSAPSHRPSPAGATSEKPAKK